MKILEHEKGSDEHARHLQSVYKHCLDRGFIAAYSVYASSLVAYLRNLPPTPEGKAPASDVDISSIGVIEMYVQRRYGHEGCGVEVLDVGEGT